MAKPINAPAQHKVRYSTKKLNFNFIYFILQFQYFRYDWLASVQQDLLCAAFATNGTLKQNRKAKIYKTIPKKQH